MFGAGSRVRFARSESGSGLWRIQDEVVNGRRTLGARHHITAVAPAQFGCVAMPDLYMRPFNCIGDHHEFVLGNVNSQSRLAELARL